MYSKAKMKTKSNGNKFIKISLSFYSGITLSKKPYFVNLYFNSINQMVHPYNTLF